MTTTAQTFWFVFDVETIGLYGEAFAVGYVVVDRDGVEHAAGRIWCHPIEAEGSRATPEADDANRAWVAMNVPWDKWSTADGDGYVSCPRRVREAFWRAWREWRERGAVLAADVPWPCEARFLARGVEEDPRREQDAPYPLIDIASVRLDAGHDPIGTFARRENELPAHDPLADARQSARLLLETIGPVDGPF